MVAQRATTLEFQLRLPTFARRRRLRRLSRFPRGTRPEVHGRETGVQGQATFPRL